MSNTKSIVSEPCKPAENIEQAEVIDDSKDVQMNVPNGKTEKLEVLKKDVKNRKAKGGIKNDGKLEKLSVSELASSVPPEKTEAAALDVNVDAQNIPKVKSRKMDFRRKREKLKSNSSKGGIGKTGKVAPSSTVEPKKKRKFPSREEVSQAREERRKALKKRKE